MRTDSRNPPHVPSAPVATKEQDQSVSPGFPSLSKLWVKVRSVHTGLFEKADRAYRNRMCVPSGSSFSKLLSLPSSV